MDSPKSKKNTLLASVLLSLITTYFSYTLCIHVAEKFFFDKFFYQKSTDFGYSFYSEPLAVFGKRGYGLSLVGTADSKVLGTFDDDRYNIAIIGDSYVWGLGIKEEERFSTILEKKLNHIRPTRIISIGEMGNNTLDYLHHYDQLLTILQPQLSIFALVSNDSFLNIDKKLPVKYTEIINRCQQLNNNTSPSYDIYHELRNKGIDLSLITPDINKVIEKALDDSWTNPTNLCIEKEVIHQLPTNNSIYLITDNYFNTNKRYQTYRSLVESDGKLVVDSNIAKSLPKYKRYWDDNDPFSQFTVSKSEGHPNALANQMYADILYDEITSNPNFNFSKP